MEIPQLIGCFISVIMGRGSGGGWTIRTKRALAGPGADAGAPGSIAASHALRKDIKPVLSVTISMVSLPAPQGIMSLPAPQRRVHLRRAL